MRPSGAAITIASGAASSKARNFCSARRRALTSRIALAIKRSFFTWSGLKLISIGNSLPSLRRPNSSSPEPMGRSLGDALKRLR